MERLFFWTDRRGRGLRRVQGAIAARDEAVNGVATLKEQSVALQGLPALEYALFGSGSDARLGAQYEGPRTDGVPLVATFDLERGLELLGKSQILAGPMRHYVGSVAASRDGAKVAVTSSRGGIVVVWDTARRAIAWTWRAPDASGAAPSNEGIAITSGRGTFRAGDGRSREVPVNWDNHLAVL